ncbi:PIG-L family deacetylase [Oxalobacteraceae bacterium R-40]|uniref:PIG-L family deacetylase n=1 Tax=Keguizhuia sedimenti TaxID=3064264 RepID=A0ABU1BR29_9BURK|nr:PIG-L family deacetylase [Oxalobacteraceae bacterium R-40]
MAIDKHFLDAVDARLPMRLNDMALPASLTILVLAPHPDDFDAIGVSMRFLQQQGHSIHVAVLTTGASGVEDGWNGANDAVSKARFREAEQQKSCEFFGLPEGRLSFLHLWEQPEDVPSCERDNEHLRQHILSTGPDCVFLPHGNDSNRTHRRTFDTFHSIAIQENLSVLAFLNLDAKTVSMRSDIYMNFGESEAAWKAELLRMHLSQHERNLKTRGFGFDERVLRVNREAAIKGGVKEGYAEVFELKKYGRLI